MRLTRKRLLLLALALVLGVAALVVAHVSGRPPKPLYGVTGGDPTFEIVE